MVTKTFDVYDQGDAFVWRHGKDLVRLCRAGESWQVSFLTQSRLMGPRMTVHEAMHRQAKHAAWDMMARVISVCRDEEIGVDVARLAVQWMKRADHSHA
jgi:hypothetical protein